MIPNLYRIGDLSLQNKETEMPPETYAGDLKAKSAEISLWYGILRAHTLIMLWVLRKYTSQSFTTCPLKQLHMPLNPVFQVAEKINWIVHENHHLFNFVAIWLHHRVFFLVHLLLNLNLFGGLSKINLRMKVS